ncbi:response regulator [Herbaspirillum sp. ST 5-3]|uniref:ANTAR domain-containing response regulator n=1 Tax=Oxalobacteraceae TaxID=75682 RepID=UPI0010A52AAC|nr:response regulator [Herbaspirillum sp. ST 5-3]
MLKVVVIDANAISRNLLTSVLVDGGFDVVGDASSTSAGLAAMIKLKPQMICVDIGAVDAEGLERLDTLRAGLPKALVFMVSGNFDPAAVQIALERGVHGFIVKPFKSATVLNTIRKTVIKVAHQHRAGAEQASE